MKASGYLRTRWPARLRTSDFSQLGSSHNGRSLFPWKAAIWPPSSCVSGPAARSWTGPTRANPQLMFARPDTHSGTDFGSGNQA
jgi:hypothetical protein